MIWLFVLCLNPSAHALPGAAAGATAGFRNPKDTTGMCTPDNQKQLYYEVGDCKSIYEQLQAPGCCKDTLEELRLRFLQDKKQPGYNKLKNKEVFSPGVDCVSKDGKKTMDDLAKDKTLWANFMMQFFAMVAINESDWDTQAHKSPDDNTEQGLLNMTRDKLEDKQYSCGCQSDDTTDGKIPGPQDGHFSLTCGVYQGLKAAEKDGELFSGRDQRDPRAKGAKETDADKKKDSRQGAARIFKSLEGKADGGESDRVLMIREKMKQYCEKYAFGPMEGVDETNEQDHPQEQQKSDATRDI